MIVSGDPEVGTGAEVVAGATADQFEDWYRSAWPSLVRTMTVFCGNGEQGFQLVKALLGRIVCLESHRSLQLGNERIERAVGVVRRTLVVQERMRLVGDALFESGHKTGLADARLA